MKLNLYDNGSSFIAQPKYNGSCAVVFLKDGKLLKVMNRHNEVMTNVSSDIDFAGAFRGTGYMVLCGEVLNKNQKGESNQSFNHKFVIWDLLVLDSKHLIGETTICRMALLNDLYGSNRQGYEHLIVTDAANVYKAPVYTKYFNSLYEELVKTELYEGLVLKRAVAKLGYGFQSKNNHDWQMKCRKATKNYQF